VTFPFPMFVPPSLSATPATWNPADIGSGITLSNSNRTAVIATADEMARANGYKSSGKWYVEITVIVIGHAIIGIANSSLALSGGLGYAAGGHGYYKTGLFYYPNSGAGASYTNGDIIQIAFDPGDGKLWFGKNGTWQASGDPAAGTSPARSGRDRIVDCGRQPVFVELHARR